MMNENSHLSEQDLMLAANGELTARRRTAANEHLDSCWSCRERMRSLQETIADFVRIRNRELNHQLPAIAGQSALLRARLSEAVAPRRSRDVQWWRFAPTAAAVLIALLAVLAVFQTTVNAEGPKPKAGITPGETRPISIAEVCRNTDAEVIARNIPEITQRQVFAAYGVAESKRNQFEVDYLITPDLGGTESIRNLWPQPYSARWNAHVKDKLEQRLHQLVCDGQMDLATAQHDIAVDWIGAYRRYVGSR